MPAWNFRRLGGEGVGVICQSGMYQPDCHLQKVVARIGAVACLLLLSDLACFPACEELGAPLAKPAPLSAKAEPDISKGPLGSNTP